MNLRYYSEFKSISEKTYRLEIHTKAAQLSEPLLLSSNPMQVEYESGELYKPLKLSNAVIEILTGKVLTDLYTGENRGVEVRLFNLTDNQLEWFGYLTPNLYSGDYVTDLDNLSLEAVDALASLENEKYSYIADSGGFCTMLDIVFHILAHADMGVIVPNIYIQKSNRLTKNSVTNLLSEIYIQERNFFDEANEPMTFRDALEYIAKYLGMSVVQWKDGFYFIDYDFINRGSADFFIYHRTTDTVIDKDLLTPVRNIGDVGIASGMASISLGNVYNKVTVVANLNVITETVPDAFDEKDIINQNANPQKYYEKVEMINDKAIALLVSFWKSKANYSYKLPTTLNASFVVEVIEEVAISNYANIINGVYWQKCDSYVQEDGEPSALKWNNYITFVQKNELFKSDYNMFSLKKKDVVLFCGGSLIANITYKLSEHLLAHDALKTSDEVYSNTKFGAGFKNTLFPCRLAIGAYYYDGDNWVLYTDYNLKVQRGYYKNVNGRGHTAGAKWYRYKDNYGYWRWVTENQYNALSGVEKAFGNCEQNNMYYFRENDTNVFVEEWYNNECYLQDRFYLVHKNNENDRVFDTNNDLTNTVSYKMNLTDSKDGVAIRIPNDIVLTGELTFDLYMPNHLGVIPMYRTDMECKRCNAVHISDLSLVYSAENEKVDFYNNERGDSDIVYSNVINDNNVTEMDDVELLINSNARNIASYSNTATKKGENFDYLRGVYNPFEDGVFLPEKLLIDKLYRHYSTPKFQYSNYLKRNLSILSRVKENSLNKTMVVDCMSIDYANESNRVQLIEV